jgi:hypothetical protein
VTSTHTNECKELLKLMGVPYVEVCVLFIFDNLTDVLQTLYYSL